jgi:hypothetical protein
MGQSQNARSRQENLSHVEMVFSSWTLGTNFSASGSRPSIVRSSMQNTTLKINASGSNFPVTGEHPEEAIRLLLRCIQELLDVGVNDWTPAHFIRHVSNVELIESYKLTLGPNNIIQREHSEMFVRVHYTEDETVLRNLLSFFASKMENAKSSVLSVRPRGYGDLIAQISFNYAPNEVNITSENQIIGTQSNVSNSPQDKGISSIARSIKSASGLLSAATGLGNTIGLGDTVKNALEMFSPFKGNKTHSDDNGSSPVNVDKLVELVGKYKEAAKIMDFVKGQSKEG